ncbi:chemerin-like receptor 1 isoform 1-T2 [Discoglossus pictus]
MENAASTDLPIPFSNNTIQNTSLSYEDYYYDDEDDRRNIRIMHGISIFVYSVSFVFGTIGNGLIIWIAGFRMKKTVNTVWFLNLAIADFIFTFFLPISIVNLALGIHWPFGNAMCKLNSTIAFLNLFAGVFQLTVISVDRCISVVLPVWALNHRTPRLASIIAMIVWFFAFIASIPYAVFRGTKKDGDRIQCLYIFTGNSESEEDKQLDIFRYRALIVTRFILGFIIPFTVIAFCYTVIALRLYKNPISTSTKPFKIIVAVLVSFFVCWFPYHVFSFLELSYQIEYDNYLYRILVIGIPISTSMAYFNSCVNPFLYVFIGRDFKLTFLSSIQPIFEKAFSDETVETEIKSKTKTRCESKMV